jgi:organic radical activating enzyme
MNKSYCAAAFNHIYSDSNSRYKLCCHAFAHTSEVSMYNSNEHSPFEYFLSPEMENIRDRMLEGQPIGGCEKCYDIEASGYRSPRQYRYNRHFENSEYPTEPCEVELKLRIFGNHCNLSCYMCIPYNSTTRAKELKEIGMYDQYSLGVDYEVLLSKDKFQNIEDDVIKNIHLVKTIHFTGGEPFLLPRHYSFLERIPDEHKEHIFVTYDTNGTVLEYKGKSVFELLRKFKRTSFCLSCDHYGDKLAFIRHPIDVKSFEDNIRTLQQVSKRDPKFKISELRATISILNVEDLYEIREYYKKEFNIKIFFNNVVNSPRSLNVKNHPRKEQLIEKYSGDPSMNSVLKNLSKPSNPKEWNDAMDYLEKLSNHRGINFRDYWTDYQKVELISLANI